MFSRYIDKVDFKSRFRILKGGKVSLVVSAMLISSSIIGTNAYSDVISLTDTSGAFVIEDSSISTGDNISSSTTGITIEGNEFTSTIEINHNVAISGTDKSIVIYKLGTGSSVTIASGKTLSNIMSYGSSDALTLENMVNDASIAITNSGTISASSDNARGIYVYGTLFPTSVISNTSTGTISATGRDVSRGIYVSGAAINSQILNSGEITASSTNDDILNEIHPISTGIYLGALQSVGTEADNGSENSKLSNNGTLNSTANSTIETTVMGTTYSYGNIISDAKGIYVSTLTGVADELFPVIENSNDIRVESKINIDFANEEDILNMNNSALNALSTGVEVGSSSYGVINNQEHATITSLAQIDINPNGTINGYFGAISNGIKINESFISSSLMNSGAIDSQAIFNGTNESYALSNGILLDNDDGEISNSNVISNNIISKALATSTNTNSGAFSEASGIRVETDITGDANAIGSYGIMSVESKANSNYWSQAEGTGIYINADSTKLTVQNGVDWNGVQDTNAKITVNVEATTQTGHSYAEAYGINISDFEDSTMINNGTIKVTATANSYDYSVANATGISVGYSNIGNFINNGTITVKANTTIAQLGEETDAPNANGIFANNSDELNLTNTGTIEAYINGMLDEKGKSLNISGDSVTVINSGTLKGNIFVEGSLVNSGTIELPYNAVDAYVSDFTNTSTGKLTIGVMSGTEKDGFGNLVIQHSKLETESATFENGSTLGVNVLTLSGNQNLLKGQTLYNVVKATDHLNLNGTLNVTDNSALLDFSYKATNINVDAEHINGEAGAIHLNVVKGQTVSESVEAAVSEAAKNISPKVTQYTNAQGAAKAFDKIIDNIDNNPRMNSVITRLNQLSSNEAVARAVESTTPVAANATVGATTQISNGIAGIVTQRQNANISGGMNSGDGMFSENNMWIKPFGSIGSQNDKDGINGFDVKTYGLGFGADTEYKDNQKDMALEYFEKL